jgi:hypothetical protein
MFFLSEKINILARDNLAYNNFSMVWHFTIFVLSLAAAA